MSDLVCPAEYEESLNPLYKENPLIECLPPFLEFEEFYEILTKTKPVSRAEALGYRVNQRDELLGGIKSTFFVPRNEHYRLYRTIHNSLTIGYHLRKPEKKDVNLKLKSSYRDFHKASPIVSISTSSLSSSLFGISGIGKTTSIEHILFLYPKGIFHNLPNLDPFTQIPFVKLECPKDSSLKDLCFNFFGKLDAILKTSYQAIYGKKRETVDSMVVAMAKLTISHQIGMIIVDEIQHLTNGRANSGETMLNFFVNLNNTLQIPIFIVGTPESIDLFGSSYRLTRRWSGEGSERWDIIPFDDEWKFMIEQLFKYQYTEEAVEYYEYWAALFYHHCQGIIDSAIRIFVESQKTVLYCGEKKLTYAIVEKTIEEKFWLEEGAKQALRSGYEKDISNYPDLYFRDKIKINKDTNYKEATIKGILKKSPIPINFYTSILGYLLEKYPDYDVYRIVSEIHTEYIKSLTTNTSKVSNNKRSKLIANYIDGDLRNCYDDDPGNLHKKLLENNSLLNVSEYFLNEVS